jgi:hypothetical protein
LVAGTAKAVEQTVVAAAVDITVWVDVADGALVTALHAVESILDILMVAE